MKKLNDGLFRLQMKTPEPRVRIFHYVTWRAREREPIRGSGGSAPSGVQRQSPWSGVRGAKPTEAENKLSIIGASLH